MLAPHICLITAFISMRSGSFQVQFDWDKQPEDDVVDQCFADAKELRSSIIAILARMWGVDEERIIASSASTSRPSGDNHFRGHIGWETATSIITNWQALVLVISFCDPYGFMPLGANRIEVFVTPYSDYHGFEYRSPDQSKIAEGCVRDRLSGCSPYFRELMTLVHQNQCTGVQFTDPYWEPESVPLEGDDAFVATGLATYDA